MEWHGPKPPGTPLPAPPEDEPLFLVFIGPEVEGIATESVRKGAAIAAGTAGGFVIASANRTEITDRSNRVTIFERF
jgi:hypothetical protein